MDIMDKLNTTSMLEGDADARISTRQHIFMRKLTADTKPDDTAFDPAVAEPYIQTLIIKRAILSGDADPEELCLVEIETKVDDKREMQKFPLAYLRGRDMVQAPIDITLSYGARFHLTKGKGPVYLVGEMLEEFREDEDESMGEEEEEEIGESEEESLKENDENGEKVAENGAEKINGEAVDRKRKHDGGDLAAAKKLRVAKGEVPDESAA